MEWLASLFGRKQPDSCTSEFKQLYSSFVDAFVDSMNAEGPAACAAFGPDDPPATLQHSYPAASRLVALGDVHGDLGKMMEALRGASLVDAQHNWTGGDTVLVQVGDQLDRGDQELPILFALERLQREAARAGGAVHVINGNHETMNIGGNFRYATRGANASFSRWYVHQAIGAFMKAKCGCEAGWCAVPELESGPFGTLPPRQEAQSCRYSAIRPGGLVTRRFMAQHPTILQVGSTLFVHGGLNTTHLGLDVPEMNRQAQAWMHAAAATREPDFLRGGGAVVWYRGYSAEQERNCDCDMLRATLRRVGAERMIVGHTIQGAGVNSACDGLVVRVDVGMSIGCGNNAPEVLEVLDDKVLHRILADGTRVPLEPVSKAYFGLPEIAKAAAAAAAAL